MKRDWRSQKIYIIVPANKVAVMQDVWNELTMTSNLEYSATTLPTEETQGDVQTIKGTDRQNI